MKSVTETPQAALAGTKSLLVSLGIFSFFVNILMLTGPLYMLQVYDRVLSSRSEATLVALTWNLARQWVGDGIRVNAVAPGLIDTPMTAPMAALPELLAAELAHIPLGRMGTPAEVAGAVAFLASSAASYVTGHALAVDGGYLVV